MSEQNNQIPELKEFNQVPVWNSNDDIVIKGSDFETIYNFINFFAPAVGALNRVFDHNISTGTIRVKNLYPDGTEVPEEEAQEYFKMLQKLMREGLEKAQAADQPSQS